MLTNWSDDQCRITQRLEALSSGIMVLCKPSQIHHCIRSVGLSVFMERYMKTIPLTKGYETIVDNEDFEILMQYRWHAGDQKYKGVVTRVYAMTWYSSKNIPLPNLLMSVPKGSCVDHINGDSLDNRRVNLRVCTIAENGRNITNTRGSLPKGVHKHHNRYKAQIWLNYKRYHLGSYATSEEAAIAYNEAAEKYHGEFACLNTLTEIPHDES